MTHKGFLRDDFTNVIDSKPEIISTSDHPYISPPLHVLDSHQKLYNHFKDKKVLIFNWDVSFPNPRTYRYDLVVDVGLASKNSQVYLYETTSEYIKQGIKSKILPQHKMINEAVLEYLNKSNLLPRERIDILSDRLNALFAIYENVNLNSSPALLTKEILTKTYTLLEQDNLRDYIDKKYVSYWDSQIRKLWIPHCILSAPSHLNYAKLIRNGVIIRRPFRLLDEDVGIEIERLNEATLAREIQRGRIVPSFEIFLWSLFLAGVEHYGNEFGFFERLGEYMNYDRASEFQLSKHNEDGENFVSISSDESYRYALLDGIPSVLGKNVNNSKLSRINSINALYLYGGGTFIKSINSRVQELGNPSTTFALDKDFNS